MNGFIATPTMSDIDRLNNRVRALELLLLDLLRELRADGTIDDEELAQFEERLGL